MAHLAQKDEKTCFYCIKLIIIKKIIKAGKNLAFKEEL